jgi:hypothetical protein
MNKHIICLIAILALVGCGGLNIPNTPPVQTPGEGAPTGETISDVTLPPATPTRPPTPFATPTPLPEPPAGWVEYQSVELNIRLYHPPDWGVEYVLGESPKLDLRAPEGEGWVEVYTVDATNAHQWSASEEMLADPQLMAETYRAAAETDASFSAAQQMETRIGVVAWNFEGIDDRYEERVWVGVMNLPPRAVLAIGHAAEETPEWDSELVPLYQQIIWSIMPLQP